MGEGLLIGCGTLTWPRAMSREQVLAEVGLAGYDGAPAGPHAGAPDEVLATWARFGLKPAPGYLAGNFWRAEEEASILQQAHEMAAFMQAVGCAELYLGAGGFDGYVTSRGLTRRQTSGHVLPEDAMTDAEFGQFARTLNNVGEITLGYGVMSCFHNHVGSVIETGEEIDRLFDLVDRTLVFQGPDIGHLVWAGVDPVQFCRRYLTSIKTLHVKDIYPQVLAQGVAASWDYGAFVDAGIFAELGEGCVDFPAIFAVLAEAGFAGWVIVETDRTTKPTALESANISRAYLRTIGL